MSIVSRYNATLSYSTCVVLYSISYMHSFALPLYHCEFLTQFHSDGTQRAFVASTVAGYPHRAWLFFGLFPAVNPETRSPPLPGSPNRSPSRPPTPPTHAPSPSTAFFLYDHFLLYALVVVGELLAKYAPVLGEHQEVGVDVAAGSTGEWYFKSQAMRHTDPPAAETSTMIQAAFYEFDKFTSVEDVEVSLAGEMKRALEKEREAKTKGKGGREEEEEEDRLVKADRETAMKRLGESVDRATGAAEAVVVMFDTTTKDMRVATVGSGVRAIMGTKKHAAAAARQGDGTQQTDGQPDAATFESVRLYEPNTSIFGAAHHTHKWPAQLEDRLIALGALDPARMPPPALPLPASDEPTTAIPVVVALTPSPGDFLILASGLGTGGLGGVPEDREQDRAAKTKAKTTAGAGDEDDGLTDGELVHFVEEWMREVRPAYAEVPPRLVKAREIVEASGASSPASPASPASSSTSSSSPSMSTTTTTSAAPITVPPSSTAAPPPKDGSSWTASNSSSSSQSDSGSSWSWSSWSAPWLSGSSSPPSSEPPASSPPAESSMHSSPFSSHQQQQHSNSDSTPIPQSQAHPASSSIPQSSPSPSPSPSSSPESELAQSPAPSVPALPTAPSSLIKPLPTRPGWDVLINDEYTQQFFRTLRSHVAATTTETSASHAQSGDGVVVDRDNVANHLARRAMKLMWEKERARAKRGVEREWEVEAEEAKRWGKLEGNALAPFRENGGGKCIVRCILSSWRHWICLTNLNL